MTGFFKRGLESARYYLPAFPWALRQQQSTAETESLINNTSELQQIVSESLEQASSSSSSALPLDATRIDRLEAVLEDRAQAQRAMHLADSLEKLGESLISPEQLQHLVPDLLRETETLAKSSQVKRLINIAIANFLLLCAYTLTIVFGLVLEKCEDTEDCDGYQLSDSASAGWAVLSAAALAQFLLAIRYRFWRENPYKHSMTRNFNAWANSVSRLLEFSPKYLRLIDKLLLLTQNPSDDDLSDDLKNILSLTEELMANAFSQHVKEEQMQTLSFALAARFSNDWESKIAAPARAFSSSYKKLSAALEALEEQDPDDETTPQSIPKAYEALSNELGDLTQAIEEWREGLDKQLEILGQESDGESLDILDFLAEQEMKLGTPLQTIVTRVQAIRSEYFQCRRGSVGQRFAHRLESSYLEV